MTRAVTLAEIADTNTFIVDGTNNRVGIASTTPTVTLDVDGVVKATSFTGSATGLTGTPDITVRNITGVAATFTGVLTYEDVTNIDSVGIITAQSDVVIADKIIHLGDTNTAIRFPAADTFTVETGGGERLRVDDSGRLLLGTITALSNVKIDSNLGKPLFQVSGGTYQTGAISVTRTNNSSPYIYLNSGSSGANATGSLGRIMFNGFDGTNYVAAASIEANVSGTPGTNDMPGRLTFSTSADGSQVPTERLRITPTGSVHVGTTNDVVFGSRRALTVANGTTGGVISLYESTTATDNPRISSNPGGSEINDIGIHAASTNGDIIAYTNNDTERLRIDSSGRLLIGTTTEGEGNADDLTVATSGSTGITIRSGTTSYGSIYFSDATSGNGEYDGYIQYNQGSQFLTFGTAATERLRITSNGTLLAGATAAVGEGGTPADLNSTEVGRGYINLSRDDTAAADHILFGKNGSIAASMGTDTTNTLVFKTGTTERLRIDSNGNFIFKNGAMVENGNVDTTARTGTQNTNLDAGMVVYFSTASTGTWKPNFRISGSQSLNSVMADGDVISPTTIVAKGATSHYSTTIQIDGSDVTPKFLGGAPSDGGGSGTFDIYSYTIIKTANATFTVFASVSNYE